MKLEAQKVTKSLGRSSMFKSLVLISSQVLSINTEEIVDPVPRFRLRLILEKV